MGRGEKRKKGSRCALIGGCLQGKAASKLTEGLAEGGKVHDVISLESIVGFFWFAMSWKEIGKGIGKPPGIDQV